MVLIISILSKVTELWSEGLAVLLGSNEESPGLVSRLRPHLLRFPALFNVMKVLIAELQDKLLLDLVEVNQFILEDVHHHPCLVQSLHIFKTGLLQDLSVLLDGVEVVVPALDVLLEVVAVRLVPVAVVRD